MKEREIKTRTDVDEFEYSYSVIMDTAYLDKDGALRPDSFAKMSTCIMDWHTSALNVGNPELMRDFGAAWALLYLDIKLKKPAKRGEKLTGKTWCPKRKKTLYDRDLVMKDEAGDTVFEAGTLWTLLDVHKRAMYTGSDVLERMVVTDAPSICPKKKLRFKQRDEELEKTEEVKVRPSWIDGSGHMNNARYAELVFDAMTPEMRDRMAKVKEIEYFFQNEFSEGETIIVKKHEEKDQMLAVCEKQDGSIGFACKVMF